MLKMFVTYQISMDHGVVVFHNINNLSVNVEIHLNLHIIIKKLLLLTAAYCNNLEKNLQFKMS